MPAALLLERDGRVGDFLDDKLQTAADLQTLDDLINSVREQHSLLRQQVRSTFGTSNQPFR